MSVYAGCVSVYVVSEVFVAELDVDSKQTPGYSLSREVSSHHLKFSRLCHRTVLSLLPILSL